MDGTDGSARVPGDNGNGVNDGLLVELAKRLLSQLYPGESGSETARLLPGEIPATVLAEVPLPEDRRIIGSAVLPTRITVVMESTIEPDRLQAFYNERMLAAGWTKPEWPGMHQGGFEFDVMRPAIGAVFCRGSRGPELRVTAVP